jgi:type VI protein secretion system component Hcp
VSPARSRSRKLPFAAGPVLAAVMTIAGVNAGNVAWLDFNGLIPGEESTDHAHRDWIKIEGFDFESTPGQEKPFTFGVLKRLDKASPKLFHALTTHTAFPEARLDFAEEGFERAYDLCRVELEDVFVISQTTEAGTDDLPSEKVGLGFRKITYTYFATPTKTHYASFDYETHTASSGSTGDGTPNPDSDSDGLPDSWETTYGLSVGTNDAGADPDGDGFTNREEYLLGTHPKSGSSFFKATVAPNPASPGNFTVSWNAAAGKTYLVQWSPDLRTAFTTIATVTASSSAGSAPVPGNGTIGFYRVRLQE